MFYKLSQIKSAVKFDNLGSIFNTSNRVKQGDLLSSKLFIGPGGSVPLSEYRGWLIGLEDVHYIQEYIYLGQIVFLQSRQEKLVERHVENVWRSDLYAN